MAVNRGSNYGRRRGLHCDAYMADFFDSTAEHGRSWPHLGCRRRRNLGSKCISKGKYTEPRVTLLSAMTANRRFAALPMKKICMHF